MRHGHIYVLVFLALGCVIAPSANASVSSTEAVVTSSSDIAEPNPLPPTLTQEVLQTPVILQMADGRFYHPATGKMAMTREELLAQLGLTGALPFLDATSSTITVASSTTTTLPVFPLRTAIEEGRAQLRLEVGTSTVESFTALTQKVVITFAVWDPAVSSTAIIAEDVIVTTSIRLIEKTITLQDLQKKGIRSIITSLKDKGTVVAVYYPLITEKTVKKKKQYTARFVVYSPYSASLHTDEMVALGKARLRRLTQDVYTELREEGVKSRAFPDKLIADAIDDVMPQAIAAIEHIDYQSLHKKGEEGLEPFYVLFAANPDNAFGYSLSPAGARGLAQFMPATYASLVKHRPDAKLEKHFEKAMEQPKAALKAGIVYLDLLLLELPKEARERYLADEDFAREFVVAAYNGGPARVSRVVATWEEQMESGPKRLEELRKESVQATASVQSLKKQVKAEKVVDKKAALNKKLKTAEKTLATVKNQIATLQKAVLRAETIEYIRKYRYVASWLRGKTEGEGAEAGLVAESSRSATEVVRTES